MNDTLSPAKLDQIVETRNRQVIVDADSCSVVRDLREIDRNLGVRFVDGPQPFFAVYQEINHPDGRVEQHMVTTAQAYPTAFGTYTGLDGRIVDRVREITHESYDFGKEAEKRRRDFENNARHERAEKAGEMGEMAAHAIRKDLGSTNRAFFEDRS
jgi:hypothetical protein